MSEVKQFKIFNNAWESYIFERGSRPAVICPTDSGRAAKLMPSQWQEIPTWFAPISRRNSFKSGCRNVV